MQRFISKGKPIDVGDSTIVTIETGRYRNAYKLHGEYRGPEGAQTAVAIFDGMRPEDGRKVRLRVNGAVVAVKRSDRIYRGTPPHDAATATGMYDHW